MLIKSFTHVMLLSLMVFSLSCTAAEADDEFLTADNAFQFSSKLQADKVVLSWQIAPGYYLYKNKLKLKVDDKVIADVALPEGEMHSDEFFGEQQVYRHSLSFELTKLKGDILQVSYQGCADAGLCYPPVRQKVRLTVAQQDQDETMVEQPAVNQMQGDESSLFSQTSIVVTLAMFFALGLGLSFTPCVFPMYPILTGIIVGQQQALSTKRAFWLSFTYVQGMAVTYTLMGIIVAFAGMQFQAAFQHPAVLIVMSVIFVLLALSMFGVFNLALPSSWQQKLNSLSNQQQGGSYLGVALMGVISGLVASPCTTAPLTAALVYIAQSGDAVLGGLALYSLSMGMGLPLILLGASGGKLLPKAGAWMNIVKNVFGILLLVVPVMLVQRFLPEWAATLLWTFLGWGAAAYLWSVNAITKAGFGQGVRVVVIFVLLFGVTRHAYDELFESNHVEAQHELIFNKVSSMTELEEAIGQAANSQQYVLVDLYADWCIACKEFEAFTFADPSLQQVLKSWSLIQLDLTDSGNIFGKEVMKQYKVLGLPTLLVFDKTGKEVRQARITGYLDAQQFLAHLAQNGLL